MGDIILLLQLNPRIPLMTPKGPGEAIIFRDPGPDNDDQWVVLLRSNEIWTFKNSEVRGVENVTEGRAATQAMTREDYRGQYLLDLNFHRLATGRRQFSIFELLEWEERK